jgi:hypothetical protein
MNTVSSRSLARRSVLVAATVIAGSTVLLLAACGNGHAAGAEPAVINSTGAVDPPGTGTPTAPATSTTPVDGCPVSAGTLLTALRAGSQGGNLLEPASSLTSVQCYQGYAMARTTVVHTDSAHVVFRYHSGDNAWKVIAAGTEGFCVDAVRPHLTGC